MSYPANLGGIPGADAICAAGASAAGLTGTFVALLSDSSTNARDHVVVGAPLRDTLGNTIANDATDLWDGAINMRVRYTATGTDRGTVIVWTGTDQDGQADRATTTWCSDWRGTSGGVEAGRTDRADNRWVSIYGAGASSAHACSNDSALYCVGG